MALLTSVFFDSNVFLASLLDYSGEAEAADLVLDAIQEGMITRPLTAWHCCLEVYAVMTRIPAPRRVTPAQAFEFIDTLILSQFRVLQLPVSDYRAFLASASADGVSGGQLYDAEIAAVARYAGAATFVTSNRRHFTGLLADGIRVLTPAELLPLLSS